MGRFLKFSKPPATTEQNLSASSLPHSNYEVQPSIIVDVPHLESTYRHPAPFLCRLHSFRTLVPLKTNLFVPDSATSTISYLVFSPLIVLDSLKTITPATMSNQSHLQDGPALGSELTASSSRAPALPSNSNYATEGPIRNKIEYNYKYPTLQPDGTVIIEANFMDRNKENKRLMIAKNCEVPLEIKLRGRLSDKMDKKIQYRRCRSREPFFVQQGNNKNYNGEFIGEEAIHAMPDVERSFNHLREIIFRRSEGEFTNQSHFEMILAGTHGKFGPDGRRDYRLGFTQDQNGQVIQGCPINSHMIKNVDLIEEFHRETAFIATKLLESLGCPRDVLDLVRRQYDVNAPCTYGSEDNKYFST